VRAAGPPLALALAGGGCAHRQTPGPWLAVPSGPARWSRAGLGAAGPRCPWTAPAPLGGPQTRPAAGWVGRVGGEAGAGVGGVLTMRGNCKRKELRGCRAARKGWLGSTASRDMSIGKQGGEAAQRRPPAALQRCSMLLHAAAKPNSSSPHPTPTTCESAWSLQLSRMARSSVVTVDSSSGLGPCKRGRQARRGKVAAHAAGWAVEAAASRPGSC
jgi:hypothetical protein